MSTQINTAAIGNTGTSASTITAALVTPGAAGLQAGDLIVVNMESDGTHASMGMSVQDAVTGSPYTNQGQAQLGSSASWQQVAWHVVPANVTIPDGTLFSFTPYSGATHTALEVTCYRFTKGTISNAITTQSNAAAATAAAPALGGVPVLGQLVISLVAAAGGVLTPPAGISTPGGGIAGTGVSLGTGYATADGVSNWAETWTNTTSAVSAGMTIAFQFAGVGVPYAVAHAYQAAGSTSTTAPVAGGSGASGAETGTQVGDAIFVTCANGSGGANPPTNVTDTQSNTYTPLQAPPSGNGMSVWVYQCLNSGTALTGADHITVTWTNTSYAKEVSVVACAGVATTAPALDQAVSKNATGASLSVTTPAVLENNNEMLLGIVVAGTAAGGVEWQQEGTLWMEQTPEGGIHAPSGTSIYTSVATQVVLNNTAPANAMASLSTAAVYTILLLTLVPDPPTGAAATITISPTSLPAMVVGQSFDQLLTAIGGSGGYTWTVTTGSLPGGLTLSRGGQSSGNLLYPGFIHHGAGTGMPLTGSNSLQTAGNVLGPPQFVKIFNSCDLSTTNGWNTQIFDGGTIAGSGFTCAQLHALYPNAVIMVVWNGPGCSASTAHSSAATINAFLSSIPSSVGTVAFNWQSEPEGTGSAFGAGGGATYVAGADFTADTIHAFGNPNFLVAHTANWANYGPVNNTGTGGSFIPTKMDIYGMDLYAHPSGTHFSPSGAAGYAPWLTFVSLTKTYVKNGAFMAWTEYGVDDSAPLGEAGRAGYLLKDWQYIQAAFGPGGTVSSLPFWGWMYWMVDGGGIDNYDFVVENNAASISQWKSIVAGSGGTGGASTGGDLSGIPTTAGAYSFTVTATDSTGATATHAYSGTITSPGSPIALSPTPPATLTGGTVGATYGASVSASGGTGTGYTFTTTAGGVPGLTVGSNGQFSGTPTTAGTFTVTIKATDSGANNVSGVYTVVVSSALAITTSSELPGQVGVAYNGTVVAVNGTPPLSYGVDQTAGGGTLPPGLTLTVSSDGLTGLLTGTPTTSGTYPVVFSVSDSTGATDDSVLISMVIAQSSGGLPAIGRQWYGGDLAAFGFVNAAGVMDVAAGQTWKFWNAQSGGLQYTDLLNAAGSPVTSVVSDSNGFLPSFQGPAGVFWMWADNGAGLRLRIVCNQAGDEITTLWTFLKQITG